MSPTGPDGMHPMKPRKFYDEGNVSIIVIVGSTWYVNNNITHANVFCICSEKVNMAKKRRG